MTPESNSQSADGNAPVLRTHLTPTFNTVFVAVVGLTVLSLLVTCTLVGITVRTGRQMLEQEKVMFDLGATTFKLGFGAIIGLFGGKAL
jgi:hypothetical protein